MSNLDPQPYDKNAMDYISKNVPVINSVSAQIGVSSTAVAASISREITRADGEGFAEHLVHRTLIEVGHLEPEHFYDVQYRSDVKSVAETTGIFDGNPLIKYLSDPVVQDIGPGSIKVLNAINLIRQYQDTPQSKALGLDKYKLTDLKAIVHDLNDYRNPLSIKIASLYILNGQKYFENKSIDGIPWANLTKEQQDAALTAYYTVGEHAVSVDMEKNEFHPFTSRPKGGQVGPWVLFGDNYSKLNAILGKGGSLGLSVAPVPQRKPSQKASSKYMKYAEAGAGHAPARKILDALPEGGDFVVHKMANATNAPATKYMAESGALPQASAPGVNSAFLSAVNQRGSKYAALAQGQPGNLVAELHQAQRSVRAPLSSSVANLRGVLPSIAPVAGRPVDMSTQRLIAHHSKAESLGDTENSIAARPAKQKIDYQSLRVALNDLLNAQARLPPAGPTAFDPRLTPAWAGLKLPQ
jgi:hypothetical protein